MATLDLAVIALYFCLTLGVGLWVSRRQQTAGDYFLGARDLPAWAILLSIVATETSALTVISIPAVAARGDLTFLQLPLGYLIGRLAVSVWLLPGYFRGEQDTAYARLEHRFGTPTRRLTSGIFLVTRALADGVRVYAGAIPLAVLAGWDVAPAIVVMSLITLVYTWHGGLKAVVWVDVMQLMVYVAGGVVAFWIAAGMAGGPAAVLSQAAAAGKLRWIDPAISFTATYTLLGGVVGGAMLSAASHGTDHLIVQRLLASRGLAAARFALVGSGVVVFIQFTLFLLIGIAMWAAGQAPTDLPADQLFPRFVVNHFPHGLSGLIVAAVLAASMATHSSAISALASSVTHDFYASATGRRDPAHLLKVGKLASLVWGVLITVVALVFHATAGGGQTPVVVFALSIASITYGALLGAYLLAAAPARIGGPHVLLAVAASVAVMLTLFLAKAPLAWPWYVPAGALITLVVGFAGGAVRPHREGVA
ncbi:MAG: sodium:solute symporter [Gemmatimonadetes bacterium]|nr:sodium:solute symporter [Gemmatimonadota bacterium]MBK6779588.1 sodium:solute symporter [Gemmatimonadota bacterium]MBK7716171.1 sodium:solute symporter [Gemmatimonadota bacterium]MBK7923666.1 sodium:solute symporter [Gemmatimonadota bacterium]